VAERRTKVYLGKQEQRRDEADAVAHGWRVISRDSGPEGYRVTYELASSWAGATDRPPARGIRRVTWLFILWNLVFLVAVAVRISTGGYLDGDLQTTIRSVTHSGLLAGIGLVWLIGFLVIGMLWLRGRSRT
jgi:hypothetical protein